RDRRTTLVPPECPPPPKPAAPGMATAARPDAPGPLPAARKSIPAHIARGILLPPRRETGELETNGLRRGIGWTGSRPGSGRPSGAVEADPAPGADETRGTKGMSSP